MSALLTSLRMFRELFELLAFRQDTAALLKDARRLEPPSSPAFSSVLIVPSDAFRVTGSFGDDATLTATVSALRSRGLAGRVGIVTADGSVPAQLARDGFRGVNAWKGADAGSRFVRALADYGAVVVVGADMMDGHYSLIATLKLLRYAVLGAAAGRSSVILGFSFNEQPSRYAIAGLRELGSGVSVNVRDVVSLARFKAAVDRSADLVADVAFLLQPDGASAAVRAAGGWIEEQRAQGRLVLGFNIHPMLVKWTDLHAVHALEESGARAIAKVVDECGVSILLLPHDSRPMFGDEEMLRRIEARVRDTSDGHVHLCTELIRAAEVKAVAARLDLVVTGRMHLAIAALGMGVPIGGFAYQGKFSGLLKHFGLDDSLLLSGADAMNAERLEEFLKSLLQQRVPAQASVRAHLAAVVQLAAGNLKLAAAPHSTLAPATSDISLPA